MPKKESSGVTDRVATGIHCVALAAMSAPGATRAELDLAAQILLRDPLRAAPRESESVVESFNRLMDAAIESCNMSAGQRTLAGRRAQLAQDLDRAGVLLVEKDYLAGLIADRLNLELEISRCPQDGEEFGAEILRDEGDYIGEDFVGDPGRDPLGGYENTNVND